MNVVDTSGWIEFLFDGPNAERFAPLIEDTDQLLVPVICIYEVFKKACSVADESKALQAVAQMKQGRVIDITESVALRAASISIQYKIPMADSLILSVAWSEKATLWTQDEHFAKLTGVEYVAPRSSGKAKRLKKEST